MEFTAQIGEFQGVRKQGTLYFFRRKKGRNPRGLPREGPTTQWQSAFPGQWRAARRPSGAPIFPLILFGRNSFLRRIIFLSMRQAFHA